MRQPINSERTCPLAIRQLLSATWMIPNRLKLRSTTGTPLCWMRATGSLMNSKMVKFTNGGELKTRQIVSPNRHWAQAANNQSPVLHRIVCNSHIMQWMNSEKIDSTKATEGEAKVLHPMGSKRQAVLIRGMRTSFSMHTPLTSR